MAAAFARSARLIEEVFADMGEPTLSGGLRYFASESGRSISCPASAWRAAFPLSKGNDHAQVALQKASASNVVAASYPDGHLQDRGC